MSRRPVSFPKEMRERAKAAGKGLMAIGYETATGSYVFVTGPATPEDIERIETCLEELRASWAKK